jgi:aspartate aminotransferase-like enzyme
MRKWPAAEPCFRIGRIGRLFPAGIETLLTAMRRVLKEAGAAPSERGIRIDA